MNIRLHATASNESAEYNDGEPQNNAYISKLLRTADAYCHGVHGQGVSGIGL